MSPIFDFRCDCGHFKIDELVSIKEVVICPCGEVMTKDISAPSLGNMDKLGRSK